MKSTLPSRRISGAKVADEILNAPQTGLGRDRQHRRRRPVIAGGPRAPAGHTLRLATGQQCFDACDGPLGRGAAAVHDRLQPFGIGGEASSRSLTQT
jgi:hypothetical protein